MTCGRCLDAIASQQFDAAVEIVVVDSGSRDGSAGLGAHAGARVARIPPEEFNHGATRNLGAALASGDVLVFISQDASRSTTHGSRSLVAPLAAERRSRASTGASSPHEDASPPERYFLDFLYGAGARVQRAGDGDALTWRRRCSRTSTPRCRRSVLGGVPFVDDIVMSEDQEWSRRVLLAGYALVYEPPSGRPAFARVQAARGVQALLRLGRVRRAGVPRGRRPAAARPSPRRAPLRPRGAGVAVATGQRRWIPYAALYELAKFVRAPAGDAARAAAAVGQDARSALPGNWERQAPSRVAGLGLVIVVGSVLIVASIMLVLSLPSRHITGHEPGQPRGVLAFVPGGGQVCQATERMSADTGVVAMTVGVRPARAAARRADGLARPGRGPGRPARRLEERRKGLDSRSGAWTATNASAPCA